MVKTHILIAVIKCNPSHDDTTGDEQYQFTCVIDNGDVFRDGANVDRINFRGEFMIFEKKKARCPLCTISHLQYIDIQLLLEYNIEKGMFLHL